MEIGDAPAPMPERRESASDRGQVDAQVSAARQKRPPTIRREPKLTELIYSHRRPKIQAGWIQPLCAVT